MWVTLQSEASRGRQHTYNALLAFEKIKSHNMIYAGHFTLRIIRAVLAIFSLAVLHARAETLATHPSVHPLPHAIGLPAGSAGIYEGVITGARDAREAIKTCGPQEQWDDMRRSLHATSLSSWQAYWSTGVRVEAWMNLSSLVVSTSPGSVTLTLVGFVPRM